MARSIAKGPKPRAGFATIKKGAPKPYVKAPWKAPEQPKAKAAPNEPLGTVAVALLRAQKHGIAKVDARILLLHCLGIDTAHAAWLVAHDADPITMAQAAAFGELCARRRAGEPVAYIVGHKAFYGLRLRVDKRVLDPRDDTETLVDWALERMPSAAGKLANAEHAVTDALVEGLRVLDLGTGSGAVALAIKSKRPDAQVHATDASAQALEVATGNAARLKLKVQFHQGHWLQAVGDAKFDLIVSNPPYIAAADPHLAALTHEPLSALASGADGLDDIRQIIAQASAHLHAGGWLLLEHGHDQAAAVCTLLQAAGYQAVQSRPDLAGIARCSGGQTPA
jgi:release factor glutamine methyltransferase